MDVRRLRLAFSFSQTTLATLLGVSLSTLKRWERAGRGPDTGAVLVLLEALEALEALGGTDLRIGGRVLPAESWAELAGQERLALWGSILATAAHRALEALDQSD